MDAPIQESLTSEQKIWEKLVGIHRNLMILGAVQRDSLIMPENSIDLYSY